MNQETPTSKVKFSERHLPALISGEYTIEVEQTLSSADNSIPAGADTPKYDASLKFSIAGERFRLSPQDVHSVFPPAGSLGDYTTVLPHIMLQRKTLPWERESITNDRATPWLALLVFRADEFYHPEVTPTEPDTFSQQLSPGQLLEAQSGFPKKASEFYDEMNNQRSTSFAPDTGEADEAVNIIYIAPDVLQDIIPDHETLRTLTHIRQGLDASSQTVGEEIATLISNRLPAAHDRDDGVFEAHDFIIHLVSLENRLKPDGSFDFGAPPSAVPLLSLYSWRYRSISPRHTFHGLLQHLNHEHLFEMDALPMESFAGEDFNTMAHEALEPLVAQFAKAGITLSPDARVVDGNFGIVRIDGFEFLVGIRLLFVNGLIPIYDRSGRELAVLDDDEGSFIEALRAKGLLFNVHDNAVEEIVTLAGASGQYWWIQDRDQKYFLASEGGVIGPGSSTGKMYCHRLASENEAMLRLPPSGDLDTDQIISQGYVPAPHQFREGSKSVSWYRGPFVLSDQAADTGLEARGLLTADSPDKLLRYFRQVGMIDTTYAAAWELGRLLALNSKHFATNLDKWKRHYARKAIRAEQERGLQVPFAGRAESTPTLYLDNIKGWLQKLRKLEGIPFNYLLPDEQLLPKNSIRFVFLDPSWIKALIGGTLSIGRGRKSILTDGNALVELDINDLLGPPTPRYSGFFLRSEVVSGFPGMLIEAYDHDIRQHDDVNGDIPSAPLPVFIKKQLTPDIMLCLFEGDLRVVDFHLKPEVLHFGFEIAELDEGINRLAKQPRAADGTRSHAPIFMRNMISSKGIVDIQTLSNTIANHDSVKASYNPDDDSNYHLRADQFAVAMTAGVDRVRFYRTNHSVDFTIDDDDILVNTSVQFTDLSEGEPTAWAWSFPGGIPSSSTEQHPSVLYLGAGQFDAHLEVTYETPEHQVKTRSKFSFIRVAPFRDIELDEDTLALIRSGINFLLVFWMQLSAKFDAVRTSSKLDLGPAWTELKDRTFTPTDEKTALLWHQAYQLIYSLNKYLEAIETVIPARDSARRAGEQVSVRLLRTILFYYLWKYYGNVPLELSPAPSPDLTRPSDADMENFLQTEFQFCRDELLNGVIPFDGLNLDVALGFLARLALDNDNLSAALSTADQIIQSGRRSLFPDLVNFYTVANTEAILSFPQQSEPEYAQVSPGEQVMVLRYTEILLIAAEASLGMKDNTRAMSLLNQIRQRNGEVLLASVDRSALFNQWLEEYKSAESVFFFTRRRFRPAAPSGPIGPGGPGIPTGPTLPGGDANDFRNLLPIPDSVISAHPGMVQNPGY